MPRIDAQPIVDLRSGEQMREELLLRMVVEHRRGDRPGSVPPASGTDGSDHPARPARRPRRGVCRRARTAGCRERSRVARCATPIRSRPSNARVTLQQVPPQALTFEVTETATIPDMAAAERFAERVTQLGCGLALDDFGAGHGGLAYLKHLPFGVIKIDRQFVRDVTRNRCSRAVVEAVVHLAGSLDLVTVAEGIEDERTLEVVRDLGVDYGQGFFIGHPTPMTPLHAVS